MTVPALHAFVPLSLPRGDTGMASVYPCGTGRVKSTPRITARPGACPDNLSAGGAELPERDRKAYRGL